MKIFPECIPCTFKVCLSALNAANAGESVKYDALRKLCGHLLEMDINMSPCEYHSRALHFINQCIGVNDPFSELKRNSNRISLACMERVQNLVRTASDPLHMAFKVSAAGNIVDMGILPDFDLDAAIGEIPSGKFYIDDYKEFRKLALSSGSVLIVGDNSGEIAFDMLPVIELLKLGVDVVYAVKGGPVLNDATMEDAAQVGMTGICRVIDNGSNYLGTNFNSCSAGFAAEFGKAGAVIFKGQANYESLEGSAKAGEKSFFILRVKCECLAKYIGVPAGSALFMRNIPRPG